MKVMIVDDCREMRELIRALLAGFAGEFVECTSAEQAVASYGTERPDWAIMDVVMGPMDGLTATQLITSRFPGSRVIVITQHNHPKLRERAREVGARGFLPKEDLIGLKPLLLNGAQQITNQIQHRRVPQTHPITETNHER